MTTNTISQPEYTHTFTKAICDETNYCEDYEVACNKNKLKSLSPTGFSVQNSASWQDPRTPEQRDRLCD